MGRFRTIITSIFRLMFIAIVFYGSELGQGADSPNDRQNNVVAEESSDGNKWEIKTYYLEDRNTVIDNPFFNSQTIKVSELYLGQIKLSKIGTEEFEAKYFGPLYSQCSGGSCDPQGYQIRFDRCGNLKGFGEQSLKTYDPNSPSKHLPFSQAALQRVVAYSNSHEIMEGIYSDISGRDGKSNYILGGSSPTNQFDHSAEATHLGSTRWALNAWGTNTVATFFIHLDMIRETLRAKGQLSGCPEWPRFLGRTPLPKPPENIEKISSLEKRIEEAERAVELNQRRLDNAEIEHSITLLSGKLQIETLHCIDVPKDSTVSKLNEIIEKYHPSPSELESIKTRLSVIPHDGDRSNLAHWILSDYNLKSELKNLNILKQTQQDVFADEKLDPSEKVNLFRTFIATYASWELPNAFGDTQITSENFLTIKPTAQEESDRARGKVMQDNWLEILDRK